MPFSFGKTYFGHIFGASSYDYNNTYVPASLKTVIITSGYIYDYAFNGCTSITSVTIGNGVTGFRTNAFIGCTSLTSVTFALGSDILNTSFDNNVFPEGSTGAGGNTLKTAYFAASTKAGTYTRPDTTSTTWTRQE